MTDHEQLTQLERYLDTAPRFGSRVEHYGALTLFVRSGGGWFYYARPTPGAGDVTARDLEAVRDRQRNLDMPQALEWVHETTPSLRPLVEQAGMSYEALPLMVLRAGLPVADPIRVRTQLLTADDPQLPLAIAVANVGFAHAGTQTSTVGVAERDANAQEMTHERLEAMRSRIRAGLTVTAAAIDDCAGPLSVGSHNPAGDVTEIVGVATLPAARRQGLAAAVTARLVADAQQRGTATIFLSAGTADVARMYAQLGFERIGTSCIAH